MARQFIISIIVFGFFGFAASPAFADNIGVGKPSSNTTTNMTSSTTTEDNIGVGEESWFDLFLQYLESTETTNS